MKTLSSIVALLVVLIITVLDQVAVAHCDTYSGPVVSAARRALETQNVRYVFIWVKKDDENEIEEAFRKALTVRKLGPEAKELADKSFFETVVRLHRAAEGAPYTGLKEAEHKVDPLIALADQAVQKRSIASLDSLLRKEVHDALHTHFKEILDKEQYDINDVEKGRAFVKAYVEYVHFVEMLSGIVHRSAPSDHHPEDAGKHSH